MENLTIAAAMKMFMNEVDKGFRSGEMQGWIDIEDVEEMLGIGYETQ